MSKDDENVNVPTICDRRIWAFYEWAVIFAPIVLMLSHWYIFYVFSQNQHELMYYSKSNEICIAWIYSILYLYVPLMVLPASYFFRWCNLFRIPFIYFIFINVERWEYGSWFCTNEMIKTHIVLIKCIVCVYAFELIQMYLSNLNTITAFFHGIARSISLRIRWKLRKMRMKNDEQIDQIIRFIEEENI